MRISQADNTKDLPYEKGNAPVYQQMKRDAMAARGIKNLDLFIETGEKNRNTNKRSGAGLAARMAALRAGIAADARAEAADPLKDSDTNLYGELLHERPTRAGAEVPMTTTTDAAGSTLGRAQAVAGTVMDPAVTQAAATFSLHRDTEAAVRRAENLGNVLASQELRAAVRSRDASIDKLQNDALDQAHAAHMKATERMKALLQGVGGNDNSGDDALPGDARGGRAEMEAKRAEAAALAKLAADQAKQAQEARAKVGGRGAVEDIEELSGADAAAKDNLKKAKKARGSSPSLFSDLPVVHGDPLFEHTRNWLTSPNPIPGHTANAQAMALIQVRRGRGW